MEGRGIAFAIDLTLAPSVGFISPLFALVLKLGVRGGALVSERGALPLALRVVAGFLRACLGLVRMGVGVDASAKDGLARFVRSWICEITWEFPVPNRCCAGSFVGIATSSISLLSSSSLLRPDCFLESLS